MFGLRSMARPPRHLGGGLSFLFLSAPLPGFPPALWLWFLLYTLCMHHQHPLPCSGSLSDEAMFLCAPNWALEILARPCVCDSNENHTKIHHIINMLPQKGPRKRDKLWNHVLLVLWYYSIENKWLSSIRIHFNGFGEDTISLITNFGLFSVTTPE